MLNKWFIVGLGFFMPPLAFIYLAKFKWAFIYFIFLILFGFFDLLLVKITGYSGLGLILGFTCSIHAVRASSNVVFNGQRKWYGRWWSVLTIFSIIVLALFSLRSFFYETFQMYDNSMSPTIRAGNLIFISKFGYGNFGAYGIKLHQSKSTQKKKPNRGEIFTFDFPYQMKRIYIKRIIGLPGDVIEYSNKQLIINGQVITTKQVNDYEYKESIDGISYSVQYTNDANQYREFSITIPKDKYFVMGDNRDNSIDSRAWGVVPGKNIIGKLILVW